MLLHRHSIKPGHRINLRRVFDRMADYTIDPAHEIDLSRLSPSH